MKLLTHKDKYKEYMYYWDTGQLIFHGLYRSWHYNDKLKRERNFKKGKRHGLDREWYDNGKLASEVYYWEDTEYSSREDYEDQYEERLVRNRNW